MGTGEQRKIDLEHKITGITEQMEVQKGIIEKNQTLFYEKKREKDNLANERK